MTAVIRKIPLDQALPGMVLGDDVTSSTHMLLPRGTVINAAHIDSLRRREVGEIAVLAPSELSVAEIEERREALRGRVERLFRRAGSDATMQALLRAVLEYRLEGLE
ncbi:MAG: hypothetical protein ACTS6J_23150 [Burkholderiales bacterium]